jgi:hypothetical protein
VTNPIERHASLLRTLVPLAARFWLSREIESRALHAAENRTAVVANGVINALNTLMQ